MFMVYSRSCILGAILNVRGGASSVKGLLAMGSSVGFLAMRPLNDFSLLTSLIFIIWLLTFVNIHAINHVKNHTIGTLFLSSQFLRLVCSSYHIS